MNRLRIISGTASADIVLAICSRLSISPTARTAARFNDGEVRVKIGENVRGDDVFVVNATHAPFENIAEIAFLANAARYSSARRVTLVIPYLGYNRQDRKDEGRVPVTAKMVIEFLKLANANRVLLVDLHSEATASHFEPMVCDHLYASMGVMGHLETLATGGRLVIAAPDAGAGARARKYAQYLGHRDVVFFDKRRTGAGVIDESSIKIIGRVRGRDVLFVDDMIDTGGTMIADARAAKAAGARRIFAFATHGIFSKGRGVFTSDLFEEVVVTDTIRQPVEERKRGDAKITVLSVAPLLADAIQRIHHEESLSDLILK